MSRNVSIGLGVWLLLVSGLPAVTLGQERDQDPMKAADLKPQRVTLFKNGYGVVTARADLPGAGGVRIAELPKSTLGSFWLGWSGDTRISEIVARHALVSDTQPAGSIPELLQANVGNEVSLLISNEWVTGTIRAIPQPHTKPQPQPQPAHRGNHAIFPPPRPVGDTLLLETADRLEVIRISHIQRLGLPRDAATDYTQHREEPALDFTVTQPGEDPTLWVEYMASGIAWSPSYRVDISNDQTATLTAKAVIVNDLLDMHRVDVELVTGYPHLQHADSTSGFWLEPLQTFLQGMRERDQRRDMTANIMMQQRAYASNFAGAGAGVPAAPVGGEATEDLYFYQLPDVTLARGERGYFPLMTVSVPYEHCYTWDIPDYVDDNNRYQQQSDDKPEVVWHAINLKNTTDQPWTTAPGQTTKSGRLLGQDTLHYTPVGADTDLRITQALAIVAEQSEFEVERQRDAERFHGYRYDKVTVRGELAITNRKGTDVTVRITKQLSGEVESAEGDPQVHRLGTGLRRVNPRSELVWTVPVKADPEQPVKLTYRYTVFVRN